ncbi:acylcarnitine hydrolase [Diorhabda carinulata]|uniref:acylcarnitine hydrolase n=1 Tax=Diorhabda carinulata TaxID=1163345 RepID=UPI0025A2878C|nr:acylcarnitine hydrolase [Diorhabda carinulata]
MFGFFEKNFGYSSSSCFFIYITVICYSLAKDFKTPIDIPNQGKILGVELSKLRIQKIIAYYGIPYALPPVNNLRFAPPVIEPLPSWNGIKNDTDYPPSCLQTEEDYKESEKPFLQLISKLNFTLAEDCLYLNVFVPYGDEPKQGYATIIWFHPGNFTTGTPAMWNPHTLVYRQRVIIVTVSWRLNIMGFFTTMDGEASGNYGLMDQQAAMMWVKNNIKLFGGNPDNICLMGYGTGAVSVGLHLINPQSRGLFNKAIAMSGNFLSPWTVKHAQEDKDLLDRLANSFACNRRPTSELILCLRHADAESLVQQTSNVNWRPILDGEISNSSTPFLSDFPIKYFERGEYEKIPLLTGYTHMEQILEIDSLKNITGTSNEYLQALLTDLISGDIPVLNNTESSCVYNYDHIIDAVMFFYGPSGPVKDVETLREILINFVTERNVASSVVQLASFLGKEQPTYVYRFDMKPSTAAAISNLPEWVTVPHLFDLLYVWGVPYWSTNQDWDIRDKRISDTIMSLWIHFAKSSNPIEKSLYPVVWEPFTDQNPGILIIDGNFNMSNSRNLNFKAFEFWNKYYPKVKAVATQCCESIDKAHNIQINSLLLILQFILIFYQFVRIFLRL